MNKRQKRLLKVKKKKITQVEPKRKFHGPKQVNLQRAERELVRAGPHPHEHQYCEQGRQKGELPRERHSCRVSQSATTSETSSK